MITDSRPKLSDLYTLSQSKLLENHTLQSGTYMYLYSIYGSTPLLRKICTFVCEIPIFRIQL